MSETPRPPRSGRDPQQDPPATRPAGWPVVVAHRLARGLVWSELVRQMEDEWAAGHGERAAAAPQRTGRTDDAARIGEAA